MEDFERGSNLTINYQFFYDQILKEEVTIDELYDAIGKLEIISITLSSFEIFTAFIKDQSDAPNLLISSIFSAGISGAYA